MLDLLPIARQLPVLAQGLHAAKEPVLAKVPTAHASPVVEMEGGDTVCDTLTVYVPAAPAVPVSWAVTMVSWAMVRLASVMSEFRAIVPVGVPVTVSVVPEMYPENCTEPVAAGQ